MKLALILIITALNLISLNGSRPTITLFSNELGASIGEIGIITSLYSFLPLFFAFYIGKKLDNLNSKYLLILGGFLGALGIALPGLFSSLFSIYLSQIIAGSAQTLFILSAQDYIGRISKTYNRTRFITWFSLSVSLSLLVGPAIGGIIADYSNYQTTLLILSTVGLLGSIITLIIPNEYPETIDGNKISITKNESIVTILERPGLKLALLFSALILFSRDFFISFFPLLGMSFGYSDTKIGLFISINGLVGVLIRIILPKLIERFGNIKVLLGTMIVIIISLFGLPLSEEFNLLIFFVMLLGVGLGIGPPLSIALTFESSIKGRYAETLGIRLTLNRLTQVVTPVMYGGIANTLGLTIAFIISSGTVALGLILSIKMKRD